MSRFNRLALLFLVLTLLPISAVQANPEDTNYWQGTVTIQKVTRARQSRPGFNWVNNSSFYEFYGRQIHALGNGYAWEEVEFISRHEWQGDCYSQGQYWQDTGWEEKTLNYIGGKYVSEQKPFEVIAGNDFASIFFIQDGLYIKHEFNPGCDNSPPQVQFYYWSNGDHTFLIDENVPGDVSFDSTHILGYLDHGGHSIQLDPDWWETQTFTTTINLTEIERDTPWFSPETKGILWESSEILSRSAATQAVSAVYQGGRGRIHRAGGHAIVSIAASTAALVDGLLSFDPPDPNYTEIAVPVTPITSQQPILAQGDFNQAQADAFNALLTNLHQGIGLGRAMLTSFDRASGARAANDAYWVDQQLQASRIYADQYADLLEARPYLLQVLAQELQVNHDPQDNLTSQQLMEYKYTLIATGFSPEEEQLLAEMGVDERGKAEILIALILAELPSDTFEDSTAIFYPDFIADPDLIASTQTLASQLREFADGEDWKVFIPITFR